MDVSLNEDVEEWQDEVGQELPDLPRQKNPDDVIWGLDTDPAPATDTSDPSKPILLRHTAATVMARGIPQL